MSSHMTYLSQFTIREEITAEDILVLRRTFFADGVISRQEAEFLFALNDRFGSTSEGWLFFFVEALAVYTVENAVPQGYVTEENVSWLMEMIRQDGQVDAGTELMLLVKILETARLVPQTLVMYTLEMVKLGILAGDGPLHLGTDLRPGVIDAGEVELLRRVLYAVGGDGNIAVSKAEAEFLFDLNEQSDERANHPSWQELFVKATANYLMAANGYTPLAREEVLRREKWLDERGTVWNFMGRMMNFSTWTNTNADQLAGMRVERLEKQVASAQQVTDGEVHWLVSQIKADGVVSDNEKEVIRYLTEMSDDVPEELKQVVYAA